MKSITQNNIRIHKSIQLLGLICLTFFGVILVANAQLSSTDYQIDVYALGEIQTGTASSSNYSVTFSPGPTLTYLGTPAAEEGSGGGGGGGGRLRKDETITTDILVTESPLILTSTRDSGILLQKFIDDSSVALAFPEFTFNELDENGNNYEIEINIELSNLPNSALGLEIGSAQVGEVYEVTAVDSFDVIIPKLDTSATFIFTLSDDISLYDEVSVYHYDDEVNIWSKIMSQFTLDQQIIITTEEVGLFALFGTQADETVPVSISEENIKEIVIDTVTPVFIEEDDEVVVVSETEALLKNAMVFTVRGLDEEFTTRSKTFSDLTKIFVSLNEDAIKIPAGADVSAEDPYQIFITASQRGIRPLFKPAASYLAELVGGTLFEIVAEDTFGNEITSFEAPIQIRFELLELEEDMSDLGLYFFDEDDRTWSLIKEAMFEEDSVLFEVDHLTLFGIWNVENTPSVLDTIGSISEDNAGSENSEKDEGSLFQGDTMLYTIGGGALLIFILLLFFVFRVMRK